MTARTRAVSRSDTHNAESHCSSGERDPGELREALAAAAGALRVGVVDGETRLLQPVLVVEDRSFEERGARRVDDDSDTTEVTREIVLRHIAVEEHLVAEA